ncbi:hypothetical protein [Marinobacter xestospongiae]|uniref:Tetratricopeptide repeat-containing protein n=1 Tax=Marinobacter xestospongiae TaxID=994319 RepID=A0ABU3VX49_9GAMM|nr:hypothetical protein [Marinobacter xestospongiae]MDV2078852.1 hypothetical protein [Marinobacter xestospongiae]
MKHDCHYHPGAPAKWHCGDCQIHYCNRCMPDADSKKQHGLCPRCNRSMRYLGAATAVEPFWNRLGAFFRYPFHFDPLLVIAICTLVPLMLSASLVGLIVSLVLFVALLKYTYTVINHTAEGHMKPPPLAVAFTGDGFGIVFLQLLVFVLFGGLVAAAGMVGGPILGLLALALVVLAIPASIMVLAMEQSVGPAVNPLNLAALISRIGWPYFLLYGYLILLTLASGAAQDFAVTHFAPWLAMPLSGFLNSTFTLILFHMLGYLLFQYQEELGFASDLQDDQDQSADNHRDRSQRLDADIDMDLKDGRYDRVQSNLKEALKRNPQDPKRLEQFYRLLCARQDDAELYRYHGRLLGWLADRNDGAGLVDMLDALERVEPGFRIDDPVLAVRCSRSLYQHGSYRRALKQLLDFHKRFPDSDQLATAYILAAQVLANGLKQWEKATAFLGFVKKQCGDHPQAAGLDSYLEQAARREPLKGPKASFTVDG